MVLSLIALAFALQQPTAAGTYTMSFPVPDLGPMRYALTIPRGYNPRQARPLVLALHPGGQRFPGYGGAFAQQVVLPGLAALDAIVVAPDCPTRAWTDPNAERAVLALVRSVLDDYNIDRDRVLATGFSLGGRGTWFLSARYTTIFTAAIAMAGSPGDEPLDRLGRIPTYVIHSRDDEVSPYEPTEGAVLRLKKMGRPVELETLDGIGHFDMGGYVEALASGGRWVAERWQK